MSHEILIKLGVYRGVFRLAERKEKRACLGGRGELHMRFVDSAHICIACSASFWAHVCYLDPNLSKLPKH